MSEPNDRDLDALVAEKVMGWYWGPITDPKWLARFPTLADKQRELHAPTGSYWYLPKDTDWVAWGSIPRYSTNISAAMEVVERMGHEAVCVPLDLSTLSIHQYADGKWRVNFVGKGTAFAESLPRAICLAALAAIEKRAPVVT